MDKWVKKFIKDTFTMTDEEKAARVTKMIREEEELGIDPYFYDDEEEGYYDDYCDDIPEGCLACGGPYPDCMTSCKLFDD